MERKYGEDQHNNHDYTEWKPTTKTKRQTKRKKPNVINLDDLYDIIKNKKDLSYLTKMTPYGKVGKWPLEYGWDVEGLPKSDKK